MYTYTAYFQRVSNYSYEPKDCLYGGNNMTPRVTQL